MYDVDSLEEIPEEERKTFVSIDCDMMCIDSLRGIEICTRLRWLDCSYMVLSSLKGLEHCHELEYLDTHSNNIKSLAPLSGLKKLTYLNCSCTFLESLDGIQGSSELAHLDCSGAMLTSLSGLEGTTNLTFLNCARNNISQVTEIYNNTKLTTLRCEQTLVSSPDILSHFPLIKEASFEQTPLAKANHDLWKKYKFLACNLAMADVRMRGTDRIPHLHLPNKRKGNIWFSPRHQYRMYNIRRAILKLRALILPRQASIIQRWWRRFWEEELVETKDGVKVNRLCLYDLTR